MWASCPCHWVPFPLMSANSFTSEPARLFPQTGMIDEVRFRVLGMPLLAKLESPKPAYFCAPIRAIIPITDLQNIFRLEANYAQVHLNIPVSPARPPLEWLTFTGVSHKDVGGRRRSRTQFLNYVSFDVQDIQSASGVRPSDENEVSTPGAGYHRHCKVAQLIKGRWFEKAPVLAQVLDGPQWKPGSAFQDTAHDIGLGISVETDTEPIAFVHFA